MGMSKLSGNLSMQSSLTYVVSSDLLLFCLLRFFFDYEKTGRASVATLCTNLLVQKIVLSMHVFLLFFIVCACACTILIMKITLNALRICVKTKVYFELGTYDHFNNGFI